MKKRDEDVDVDDLAAKKLPLLMSTSRASHIVMQTWLLRTSRVQAPPSPSFAQRILLSRIVNCFDSSAGSRGAQVQQERAWKYCRDHNTGMVSIGRR
jgi:hypothetical protein